MPHGDININLRVNRYRHRPSAPQRLPAADFCCFIPPLHLRFPLPRDNSTPALDARHARSFRAPSYLRPLYHHRRRQTQLRLQRVVRFALARMVTDNDLPPVPAAAEHTTLLRHSRSASSTPDDHEPPPPDPKLRALLAGATILTVGLGAMFSTGLLSGDGLVSLAEWFEARGPDAIFLYGIFYFVMELVAVPAIPLTLGSGYLFGVFEGSVVVSIASTLAATAAFLISRYGLRAQISRMANQFPRFVAMDSAIGKEGFKFVFLLRLSPLLPFSISNYLYGLTSVRLDSFVLGSWLGMLPGSIAYVSAGAALNALTDINDGKPQVSKWLIALGVAATIGVLYFLGRLAGKAVKEAEERGAEEIDAL